MNLAKKVAHCLFVICFFCGIADARDLGYYRLVNATGLETPLNVFVDSQKFPKKGVAPGKKTGGWLEVGSHTIGVRHPECKDAEIVMDFELNKGAILIAYYIDDVDEATQAIIKQLVVQKAPRLADKDAWRMGVVNASRDTEPLTVSVNDIYVPLAQYASGPVLGWKGKSARISYGGESILSEPLEDPGAYLVVISGSRATKIRATLVADVDYQFQFDQWEKKKKEKEQQKAAETASAAGATPPPAAAP